MSVINKLASSLGINNEVPNQELAKELIKTKDVESIKVLVDALFTGSNAIKSDSIKTLYEIGEVEPELIAPFPEEFIRLLNSKNNRLVWGAMTALSAIALIRPEKIFEHINTIIAAIENGSVITVDNGISVLAKAGSTKKEYEEVVLPFLIKHLSTCRSKEVPQHAERCLIIGNEENKDALVKTLEMRIESLTNSQQSRVKKVIKKLSIL